VKLNEGDKVVVAAVLKEEKSIFLASQTGHVIHFAIDEINILSGVGKGVIGIKLADDDVCIGAALITKSTDLLQVETTGGKTMEFTGRHETTARGGKGWEAVKRTGFARVVPGAIQLVDWDEIEGKKREPSTNGDQGTLFN
jgi:DNA gyrase subunit A